MSNSWQPMAISRRDRDPPRDRMPDGVTASGFARRGGPAYAGGWAQPDEEAVRRDLELSDGNSHKFWSIRVDGSSHTVRFGRIGTKGQEKTKEFETADAATKSAEKLIKEKLKKGYQDAGVPIRQGRRLLPRERRCASSSGVG